MGIFGDFFDFDFNGDGKTDDLEELFGLNIMYNLTANEDEDDRDDSDYDEDEDDWDESDYYEDEDDDFDCDEQDEEDEYDSEELLNEAENYIKSSDDESDDMNFTQSAQSAINRKYIEQRKSIALSNLKDWKNGNFFGSNKKLARSHFIAKGDCEASKYLVLDGFYLYAAAVSDHFELPFVVPAEFDSVKTHFETLLVDLVEDDPDYAMKIWDWCLDTFQPYLKYAEFKNDLTFSILLDIDNFPKSFILTIVSYMEQNPEFIDKLIFNCTGCIYAVESMIATAIQRSSIEIAKKIFECALNNKNNDIHDKISIVSSTIEACSNWDELETMETFEKELFPLVFSQNDVRMKNKISEWQKKMAEYIAEVENTAEAYRYSRKNAWRLKYKETYEKFPKSPNPESFDSEDTYLEYLNNYKYTWRKFSSNRYGIDPQKYETREEYSNAVFEEIKKERDKKTEQILNEPTNTQKYRFCEVSFEFPHKPYLYYLMGGLELSVGDEVIVPFGEYNEERDGIVVAIGECYGAAFPCPVSKMKIVLKKK